MTGRHVHHPDHADRARRAAAGVALLVGLVGASIPFGLHDPRTYHVNAYEVALAVLALIAAVGVALDLARPQTYPWPFGLAAFVWAALATYAAFLPGAVVAARVSLALIFTGYAVLAAAAWRLSALRVRNRQ